MRLIDADAFKQQIAAVVVMGNLSVEKGNAICKLIDKRPTAYDVDKVVGRLEADKKELQEIIESGARDIYKNTNYGYFVATDRAISVAKSGGIE